MDAAQENAERVLEKFSKQIEENTKELTLFSQVQSPSVSTPRWPSFSHYLPSLKDVSLTSKSESKHEPVLDPNPFRIMQFVSNEQVKSFNYNRTDFDGSSSIHASTIQAQIFVQQETAMLVEISIFCNDSGADLEARLYWGEPPFTRDESEGTSKQISDIEVISLQKPLENIEVDNLSDKTDVLSENNDSSKKSDDSKECSQVLQSEEFKEQESNDSTAEVNSRLLAISRAVFERTGSYIKATFRFDQIGENLCQSNHRQGPYAQLHEKCSEPLLEKVHSSNSRIPDGVVVLFAGETYTFTVQRIDQCDQKRVSWYYVKKKDPETHSILSIDGGLSWIPQDHSFVFQTNCRRLVKKSK